MGLDSHGLKFVLESRARGVLFESVATLGRQGLHVDDQILSHLLTLHGIPTTTDAARAILAEDHGFCEPLFRLLGAGTIRSIDASPYQHASDLHDMNLPIPDELQNRFSLLIDGGTLEHVFNFPQAIANCMHALRTGGTFIGLSPANNFMGHGFYQFSPELYFRVFARNYGFVVERMVVYEETWPATWYEVRDPEDVGRRVTLVNRFPTQLLVLARKVASQELFRSFPQQSDYTTWWNEVGNDPSRPSIRVPERRSTPGVVQRARASLTRLIPARLRDRFHHWKAGNRFDPEVFKRVDE